MITDHACSAKEHARLEKQAQLLETVMGGEVLHAPVEGSKVNRVLDIGCGTGCVTDTLAGRFPSAAVYGLDLSPVPDLRGQRPNIEYLQGNALTQKPTAWTGPEGPVLDQNEAIFDYVFSRLLIAGMTDWPGLLKQEFAMLKSGGYVEHHECNFTNYDKQAETVQDGRINVMQASNLQTQAGSKLKGWLEDAGFVDVVSREYRLPWGGRLETDPGMKEVGEFWYQLGREAFSATIHGALRKLGRPAEEAQSHIDKFNALNKPDVGNYTPIYAVYGRKP